MAPTIKTHYKLSFIQKAFLKFILTLSEEQTPPLKLQDEHPFQRIYDNGYYEEEDREILTEMTKDVTDTIFFYDKKLKNIWLDYKDSLKWEIGEHSTHAHIFLKELIKAHVTQAY